MDWIGLDWCRCGVSDLIWVGRESESDPLSTRSTPGTVDNQMIRACRFVRNRIVQRRSIDMSLCTGCIWCLSVWCWCVWVSESGRGLGRFSFTLTHPLYSTLLFSLSLSTFTVRRPNMRKRKTNKQEKKRGNRREFHCSRSRKTYGINRWSAVHRNSWVIADWSEKPKKWESEPNSILSEPLHIMVTMVEVVYFYYLYLATFILLFSFFSSNGWLLCWLVWLTALQRTVGSWKQFRNFRINSKATREEQTTERNAKPIHR